MSASEWEILALDEEGEPRSVFEGMADPSQNAQDRVAELEELKEEFEVFLHDARLKEVFRCLYSGVKGVEGIAAELGVTPVGARKLRRRLAQRVAAFRGKSKMGGGR